MHFGTTPLGLQTSREVFCGDADWTCNALNAARDFDTFGEACVCLKSFSKSDHRVYGFILVKGVMMKDDLVFCLIWTRALVYFPEPVNHAEKG